MRSEKGFTLIELLIVVAIIGIIAGIAVVQLQNAPKKARESVLKEDLYALRDCIDQYFADKGKYPETLDTLVEENYLRKLPTDPITNSSETWQVVHAEADSDSGGGGGGGGDPADTGAGGIIDVKSGADGTALDGSRYSEW